MVQLKSGNQNPLRGEKEKFDAAVYQNETGDVQIYDTKIYEAEIVDDAKKAKPVSIDTPSSTGNLARIIGKSAGYLLGAAGLLWQIIDEFKISSSGGRGPYKGKGCRKRKMRRGRNRC